MAVEAKKELTGLELLRQPATRALANYLNDLRSTLEFRALLWSMVLEFEYGQKSATNLPKPDDPSHKEGSVAQMETHSIVLGEMVFCRGVNSFLTYLADLMTLIYGKYPKKLPANKETTYWYCIDHHLSGDLITALAEQTVMELTHQRPDALAKYFKNNLDLGLFTKDADSANAALCVDIRNIITHNRGIINHFFIQRNPRFANDFGKRVVLGEHERVEMLGALGFCARQLDIRAIKMFGLETIEPEFTGSANA